MALLLNGIIIGVIAILARWLWKQYTQWIFARKNGCQLPPKRRARDPFLNLDNMIAGGKARAANDILPATSKLHYEYGNTFRESSIIGKTLLHSIDPENLHAIYGHKSMTSWGVEPWRHPGMFAFMGDGFATKDGPVWERSRGLMKPSFHKANLSDMTVFEDLFGKMLSKIPRDGSVVDVQPLLLLMFMDSSTYFLLGKSIGVLNDDDITDEKPSSQGQKLLKAFQLSLMSCGLRIMAGRLRFLLPKKLTSDQWKVVHDLVDMYAEEALSRKEKGEIAANGYHSLLDSIVLQTRDKVEIRNQIIQGMTASQDTTPVLLSNTIFLLARHPGIYERLRTEAADVTTDPLKFDDTKKLSFARNIINESLRLYPVLPVMMRSALEDTVLPTGGGPDGKAPVFAAKDTIVVSNFYALHRDESIYGPDIEVFNPDRWDKISPSQWEYMAFGGGGPRACLGLQKAMAEASVALIRVAQKFSHLKPGDDKPWAGDLKLVAKNANGCKVIFTHASGET